MLPIEGKEGFFLCAMPGHISEGIKALKKEKRRVKYHPNWELGN